MKNERMQGLILSARRPLIISAVTVLLGLFLSAGLFAQEAAQTEASSAIKISADEAVEMAFKNNLSLEASRIELSTKKRASNYSWNQFIPNVTVAGAYQRQNSKPAYPQNPEWAFAVPIDVSLTLSLAMVENMRLLSRDYEAGLISYDKAKLQLERDVRKAYHSILLLQENIALLRLSFENMERQVQMAQANYNAGLAPELTLLQARVARENMRPVIDQSESGLKLLLAQFSTFLGMDYDTQFELIPISNNIEYLSLDTEEMISRATAGKPEVRELIQTIRTLKSARTAQILGLGPFLNVGWGTTPTYASTGPGKDWVDPTPGALSITMGIRLHSLIPFSADFQGVRATDDQIKAAEIGLAQLINVTEIDIYNILLTLERTQLSAEAQAETVRLAQQSYRLTEQAYRAGLQDYFQVQNAEQSLHQAQVQMLEQQFNYLNGLIDLEYAIGVPFGTLSK